jgi:precorrin-6B methylase 2
MYSSFQLIIKYVHYWLTASNRKGHGVHSPFVFQFICEVLNDDREYYCYATIEKLRQQLKYDKTEIILEDFGAGSRTHSAYKRRICDIAKSSLKTKKFGQLFFRIINFCLSTSLERDATILELGTSLGITTAYLASANKNYKVVTIEGAKAVAEIAKKNFQRLELNNIELIEGNFDYTLVQILKELSAIDFAFIDGNHRKEPTISYFKEILAKTSEHSILIFDDIHWSREMEEAWEYIKHHGSVTLSIDLFFIGIVFFRKEQREKQHFTIRF